MGKHSNPNQLLTKMYGWKKSQNWFKIECACDRKMESRSTERELWIPRGTCFLFHRKWRTWNILIHGSEMNTLWIWKSFRGQETGCVRKWVKVFRTAESASQWSPCLQQSSTIRAGRGDKNSEALSSSTDYWNVARSIDWFSRSMR